MPNKSVKKRNAREKETSQKPLAPNKLLLLVTVVPRRKAEFFLDLLQSFEVNLQMEVSAFGTASSFGLLNSDREKQALFSVIRQDMAQQALQELEKKFSTIRGGKGIAFTVPMTSTVGVAVYKFLSNKQ
ncbi:conserved domain protein [Corallococcus sp. CAG:1435]|nr:conserved domain protein [Corallococcus sp. CAG:1435]